MRFSIGYQLPDPYDSTAEIAEDYKDSISSVYFSAPGQSSARSVVEASAREEMLEELRYIRSLGIPLTLLYNANCYADGAVSSGFQKEILKTVEEMETAVGIGNLTTTSPFVARVVKKAFPEIRICASVNMWIGTEQAMRFLGEEFDGYYLQRELNRDFRRIRQLSDWCRKNSKELRLLANSGCLYTCPFHTFHDNLVAHEAGASRLDNVMSRQPSPCWDLMYGLSDEEAAAVFLQESWIRPQDIAQYEPYFTEIKLATRMHGSPRRVVAAYVRGKFSGNLFDLTEPSYSRRFSRHVLDATKFPEDWFARTSSCSRNCESCGYCRSVAGQALVSKRELEKLYLSE